jgi:hypothetical protein
MGPINMQSSRAQLVKTRETGIDPAGIILGLLEGLSSDELRRIIGVSGLTIDWQLSKGENHSHMTRIRAYIPKVQAGLGRLSEDDRFHVLAMIAKEMCSRGDDTSECMTVSLQEIGWQLSTCSNTSVRTPVAPIANTPMIRDKNFLPI